MDVSYEKHADRNVMIIRNIGDSENDYSMLSIPGIHSVAMENACDMIRNICVYQTRANTRDGIAYIINCILADRENFKL